MTGRTVSHYKILRPLGKGGMGEVYVAEDMNLGRFVAIKILHPELAQDPEPRRRFLLEAKAAAILAHPGICVIHEVGEAEGGVLYIAMELLEGETLHQRLKRGAMPVHEVVETAIAIADALSEAHLHGIVHRDIKPPNIMITNRSQVKVLDFGLAKIFFSRNPKDLPTQTATQSGIAIGTVQYMSPEQARGKKIDARSDLFSLGVVIHEMASARSPFPGDSVVEVLDMILHSEPDLSSLPSHPELRRIIRKCLEKEVDSRYATTRDLLVDLKNLKRDHDSAAKKPARKSRRKRIDSIAVLPFVHLSADPDTEYLSDGITESIINNLSQLPKLRVMARSSVFRFKGREMDPQTAGRELNVGAVLSGRVLQRGDTLMIASELVDVVNGWQLWGEKYNRKMSDIFVIQDEIAKEISRMLKLRLSGEEKKKLTKRYTENTEAYRSYLKGRYYWNRRTPEDLSKSIDWFQKAIQQDPLYAVAYAGLSDAYAISGDLGVDVASSFLKARAAATRALELDDSLAEAHTSMAHLHMHGYKWDEAEKEFHIAIRLNPGYATAYHWYFMCLIIMGRDQEAAGFAKRAQEMDPLSLIIQADIGLSHYFAGRYDLAIAQLQRALDMDQNFAAAHRVLQASYEQKEMYSDAIREYEANRISSGKNSDRARKQSAELAEAFRSGGSEGYWHKRLDLLRKNSNASSYSLAQVHAMLDEPDDSLLWLEKAFEQSSPNMIYLGVDPRFQRLRNNPRFVDLLRRIGL